MKNAKRIISSLVILAVILSAVGLIFTGRSGHQSEEQASAFAGESEIAEEELEPAELESEAAIALLVVDSGDDNAVEFELEPAEDETAFSLLQSVELEIEYKEYEGMGVMVESIAGIENGADNKYWMYYVNGEMPMVSCDQQAVSEGDRVEFRFEKSSF